MDVGDENPSDSGSTDNDTDSTSDNEPDWVEDGEQAENTFDLTLPPTHSYLGQYLCGLRGRTLLDDGIYVNFPIILNNSVVLFPGQTLPMTMQDTEVNEIILSRLEMDRTFGVACRGVGKILPFGTTAEIRQFYMDTSGFCLIAEGTQRFKILHVTKQGRDVVSANVKILPEITLGPPFMEDRLASLDRLRVNVQNKDDAKKQERVENVEAMITVWPAWVYRQYDPMRLSFKIRKQMEFVETRGGNVPEDPTYLSYWVSQNVLLDNNQRIILLSYDCAISRLQRVLKYLEQNNQIFVCATCNSYVAKQSSVFPMSKAGPQAAYCNSQGVIHETITLYHAPGLSVIQQPSIKHYSWFPGYAWKIAKCRKCRFHLGWKFKATKDNLKPRAFWGLIRNGLKYKSN